MHVVCYLSKDSCQYSYLLLFIVICIGIFVLLFVSAGESLGGSIYMYSAYVY